jgi:low temperature requirement protein LtrA
MDPSLAVGLIAVTVVLGIVLLLAFSLVGAFLPELMMVLVAIVAIVAVVAISLMALTFKNRD